MNRSAGVVNRNDLAAAARATLHLQNDLPEIELGDD
jgi:hypothetical protein